MSSVWSRTLAAAQPAPASSVAEVVAEHGRFVWVTLQRFGVRGADLDDLAQEVFLVVHQRVHTWDRASRMTTWLYGICLRVASTHRRRAYVRREQADGTAAEGMDAARPDPEQAASREQGRARLEAILDGMELERRAVFVMFEIDGMTCDEIAATTAAPLGTVYSRLRAARKDFADALRRLQAKEGGAR
jgi:RNA polymerase sigma-70 factor (ECF subfamily)